MQDEVLKHTKKIYTALKNDQHSFGHKLKEVIIEIAIIVFAVTLSISLHSWSEHRHEQKEVREFLTGLREDLREDIRLLGDHKETIVLLDSNYAFVMSAAGKPVADSVLAPHLIFDLPVTHANIGRYEGFKSSGKIGNIENDSLKMNILVFYQQTLPNVGYSESYINSLQSKIMDFQIERDSRQSLGDFARSDKMMSLYNLGRHNFRVSMSDYTTAIAQANKIIAQIGGEVGH